MSKTDTKKLVLDSNFEEMERLEPFINELQQWTGLDENESSRIMLALSEAVNNAIIHGNNENPEKQVVVLSTFDEGDRKLTISVEDEGEGFDPDEIPDPLKEEQYFNEDRSFLSLIPPSSYFLPFSEFVSTSTILFYFYI